MIWRHLVDDARVWWRMFDSAVSSIGSAWWRDATLATLFFVTPVLVIYSSRAIPTILIFVLIFSILYSFALYFAGVIKSVPATFFATINPLTLPRWAISALLLILYAGLSSFWAVDKAMASEQSFKMFLAFAMVVAIERLMPPLDENRFRYTAPFGVALAAVILIVELSTSGVLRSYFFGPNPAYLNRSVINVSLLLWPALALTTGRHYTLQRLGLIGLMCIAVFLSSSLSALLGLAAGLIVMALAYVSGRLAAIGVVIVTIAAFIAMPVAAKLLADFAMQTGMDTVVDISTERRLEIWEAFSRAALQRPLLGFGLESSRYFGIDPIGGVDWSIGPVHHPHNPILQIWVELGGIGIALAGFTMLGVILSVGNLALRRRPFAYGAVTATLAISMVSHGAWQSWWISLLMLMVAEFNIREKYPPSALHVALDAPSEPPPAEPNRDMQAVN
jgi:O-antigen ligase